MLEKLCTCSLILIFCSVFGCKSVHQKKPRMAPSPAAEANTGDLDFTLGKDDLQLTAKDGTEQETYYIKSPKTLVYSKPSVKSKVIGYFNKGDVVTAEFKKGWVLVNGKGWVPSKFVTTNNGNKGPSRTAKQLFPE